MAQVTYPFGAQAVSDTQYAGLASLWQSSGVAGSPGETALQVYADSTGMQVKVPAGVALARGFFFTSDAEAVLPVAASESQPRIDLVVVRVATATKTGALTVIKGTASTSPVAPAPTQTSTVWDVPLAEVAVGASVATIGAGDVTDVRPFIQRRVTIGRYQGDPVKIGDLRLVDTSWQWWNGSTWAPLFPATIAWGSVTGKPAGLVDGRNVTAGTAAPSGGNNGDIYLQYT
jgi:hypothetical protein